MTAAGDSGATSSSLIAPMTRVLRRLVEHGERVEAVLRRERIAHAGAVQGDCGDAPARIRAERVVEVARLVHAMERAGPEVNCADVRSGRDRRQARARRAPRAAAQLGLTATRVTA